LGYPVGIYPGGIRTPVWDCVKSLEFLLSKMQTLPALGEPINYTTKIKNQWMYIDVNPFLSCRTGMWYLLSKDCPLSDATGR
jgi:hypothetical protein